MQEQKNGTIQNTEGRRYLRILPALERLEESYVCDSTLTRAENNRRLLANIRTFLNSLSNGQEMDERQQLLLGYVNCPEDYKFNPARDEVMLHFLVLQALNLGKDMILEEVFG